jgi:flagellar hook-associated protein 3 FlgL
MRVTNRTIFETAQRQIAAARDRLQQASDRVSSGMRVVHPGDDPAAAGLMVSHEIAIERHQSIDQGVSRASDEADVADGALQSVSTLLTRARELAVQFGNDSYSASERAAGAQEIRDISGQVGVLMNTSVAGRYIFGGNSDRSPPFDAAGNYLGDTAVRQVETAPGLLQSSSIRADQALKGVGGGVDVFATLSTLATALSGNNGAGVRATIDNLGTSTDQIAAALSQIGGSLDAFQSARAIGDVAKAAVQKMLSSESEVDIFAATSQLAQSQQGLEAALAASAKSFSLSLMDFLPR